MDNYLYYGDNLSVLRDHIKDGSIDLIYLDPPFNSKANYNVLFKETGGEESTAQIEAFEDTWHWTEEAEKTYQDIMENASPKIVEMMRAFREFIGTNDMMAYLTMMCIRLIELHRVLKDTGSLYLHCDPTASHYLKILLDTIFGYKNFRNEIVWCYSTSGRGKKEFSKKHDIIFLYSKTKNYFWNIKGCRIPYTKSYIASHFTEKDENGNVCRKRFDAGKWRTYYPNEGMIPNDWWEIPYVNSQAKERLGYPTQKPEVLLERIIKTSSKEGDVVLDPFCGCGTAISVAEKLNRRWIGIDITHLAVNLMKFRMKDTYGLEAKKDYEVYGEPTDYEGAKALAKYDKYQFEWWAVSLIHARPYGDKKKGSDKGVDGYLYFTDTTDKKYKKAIIQVKGGHVGVSQIRDLGHVIDRDKAEIGIFITLEQPTRPMKEEAVAKGFYHSEEWNKDYPRLQILTIEELLEGKEPNVPHPVSYHKQAERHYEKKQHSLDL